MARKSRGQPKTSKAGSRSKVGAPPSEPVESAQGMPIAAARPSMALLGGENDWAFRVAANAAAQVVGAATSQAALSTIVSAATSLISPLFQSDKLSTRVSASVPILSKELKRLSLKVSSALDPRLQLAILNRLCGKENLAVASTDGDEVAVVARVSSVEAWTNLEDVIEGATLGRLQDANDGSWIVTARIPINRVEYVRGQPPVLSLKASQPIRPALAATLPAMKVTAMDFAAKQVDPEGGKGVVIGIVDFGCDFAHKNFLRDDKTRLLAIWNQGAITQAGSPFGYGQLFDAASINGALATANPYDTLGYGPRPDSLSQQGTHGTHVMDIAAGNGGGSGQPGVAPAADLIFVEASSSDIAWQGPAVVQKSFGDSVQLLEAVRFIFNMAGDRPCVVNLSLGTNGGPHDGLSLVEQGLDALVQEKPNRAVVIAAGNSQQHGTHTEGLAPAAGPHDIAIRQFGSGGAEVELWYPGTSRLRATMIAPDGTPFGPVRPGENLPIGTGNNVVLFVSSRLDDPNNHDNMIGVWIAEGLSDGEWIMRLESDDGAAVEYHAWIERNDLAQASFAQPVFTHTLGSISTGKSTIVVGSYDGHKANFPMSSFSSSGPTRDGREKPELSAPGHAVFAARSRTGSGIVRKSGTSMAAPATTGLIALVFAEAQRNNQELTIDQLRERLKDSVQSHPAAAAGAWDPRSGYGRASGDALGQPPAGQLPTAQPPSV
ncbi:S8 family serine peptidase (plasmid) [Rhizobium sp. TH2]|uniref:S8 family serine peptidase n=1 Tax=Rhizobium sp. TH2 TaxID=2775403 RepID=UPI00215898DB|nr:S8 family serine peptidase [Rhizobium sp. TH2]UVC12304.1 S8 family serine peptidase [Rhizobium sp. TH2]